MSAITLTFKHSQERIIIHAKIHFFSRYSETASDMDDSIEDNLAGFLKDTDYTNPAEEVVPHLLFLCFCAYIAVNLLTIPYSFNCLEIHFRRLELIALLLSLF